MLLQAQLTGTKVAQNLSAPTSSTPSAITYRRSRRRGTSAMAPGSVGRVAELQGSTAKQITDVRDAARQHTVEAINTQVEIMRDEKVNTSVRLAASLALLDRGYGKAVQHIEAEVSVYDSLGLAEKEALLAVLESLDVDQEGASGGPALTHH